MDRTTAEHHVDRLMGFYVHLTVYVLVNLLLITINILTFEGVPWAIFPILGWGIGLTAHGLRAGALHLPGLAGWRERKITELLHTSAPE